MRNILNKHQTTIIRVLLVVAVAAALILLAPTTSGAQAAVEANGFTNVTVSGPNVFLSPLFCSQGDFFYFKVDSAVNANGQTVTNLYLCSGYLKGYTIRNH